MKTIAVMGHELGREVLNSACGSNKGGCWYRYGGEEEVVGIECSTKR